MALPSPVQLIGSSITPVSFQQPASATPSTSSSPSGSDPSYLGAVAATVAAGGGSSAAPATAPSSSNASGVGTAVGAAKTGGAVTGNSTLSSAASLAGDALSVYNGVKQGGVLGYSGAALSAVKGANTVDSLATGSGFLSTGASSLLGGAGNVLGIVNGIKQGGVAGYGGAAVNALNLYNSAGTIGAALSGETASGAAVAADAAAGSVAAGGDAAGATAAAAGGSLAGLGLFGAAAMAMDAVVPAIASGVNSLIAGMGGNADVSQTQWNADTAAQRATLTDPTSNVFKTSSADAATDAANLASQTKNYTANTIVDPSTGLNSWAASTGPTQAQWNAMTPAQQKAYTTPPPATSLYNPTSTGARKSTTPLTSHIGF